MDMETAIDMLTESYTCLAEAKSCGLTCTLIHEATQKGKCWDEIKGILRLKTLKCKYPHFYLTIYGNTTKGQ